MVVIDTVGAVVADADADGGDADAVDAVDAVEMEEDRAESCMVLVQLEMTVIVTRVHLNT